MYIAKVLNRTLGLPYFFEHHVTGPESLRPFEKTFDPAYISKYQKTVNFSEFKKRCTGVVETLVWMIDDMRPWTLVTNSWKTGVGMTITNNKEAPKRLAFTDNSQIFEWFKDVKKQKCLAVAYPFRTVRPIPERRSLSLYLVHDHWIKEVASNALKEIRAQPERMLSIHWRWGETTCARWLSPEPNPDFDFCWGTSVFHYARYSDVFSSLKSLIKKAHITHIFLAVSLKYHDRLIFEKFFDDMKRENISVISVFCHPPLPTPDTSSPSLLSLLSFLTRPSLASPFPLFHYHPFLVRVPSTIPLASNPQFNLCWCSFCFTTSSP
eukprot:TRINITY_DN2181_c0_g2_i6.p1 TRINITY_DN2181_c0_g2~~TRINITY_DN2181_c0_g2_i6.p1  ORF type:complete len:323 (-),score=45.49 TRINITY_DN2181_c0_g2_i6:20-988(-)